MKVELLGATAVSVVGIVASAVMPDVAPAVAEVVDTSLMAPGGLLAGGIWVARGFFRRWDRTLDQVADLRKDVGTHMARIEDLHRAATTNYVLLEDQGTPPPGRN